MRIPRSILFCAAAGCSAGSDTAGVDAAIALDATPDAAVFALTHVQLTGCGFSYTGEFAIGGSPFRLIIDTGSATLAVADANCASCTAAGVTGGYRPGTTGTDLHEPASSTYGDGSLGWKGEIYRDNVSAGSLPAAPVAFADITSQTDFFDSVPCGDPQGILGMAPPAGLIAGTTSFPSQLATMGAVDVFALHYCVGPGDMWLDGYDPAAVTADPMWVDMNMTSYFYTVSLDDVAVDGHSVGVPSASYGQPLVDSGGPSLYLPPAAYTAVITMVGASPAFQARFGGASFFSSSGTGCQDSSETREQIDAALPKLTLKIGSPPVSIDLPATASYLQTFPNGGHSTYCAAIFTSPGLVDLGNTLIRAGLVIFDRVHSRMGFAPATPCNDVLTRQVTPTRRMLQPISRREPARPSP